MSIEHGTYEPGRGWYDRSRKGWVDKPAKLTPIQKGRTSNESDRSQVASWGKPKAFKENAQMERLIALRGSERQEEREQFHKIAAGGTRMQLADYEAAKAQAAGTEQ